jgi:hypothetical protein
MRRIHATWVALFAMGACHSGSQQAASSGTSAGSANSSGAAGGGGRGGTGGADSASTSGAGTTSGAFCPHTPSIASLPAATPPATSLAASVAPYFPQCTAGFSLSGTNVTGSGTSVAGKGDWFWGEAGVAYDVTIEAGAKLATFVDNAKGAPDPTKNAAPSDTPNNEVIAISAGSLTNAGDLATYPLTPNDTTNNYNQTSPVVFLDNDAAHPVTVVNTGSIGVKLMGSFGVSDALSGYGQENATGIYTAGDATITNQAGGYIGGYNAVFTNGSGTVDNYGTILASNDGVLSGFHVTNHTGGLINTTVAGFACIHAYGDVDNYGAMLGQDYGLLVEGSGTVNDYGGPPIAGVTNFDGSAVSNGEISALPRSTMKPNTMGPYLSADAILLDGDGITVNLIAQTVNGTLYLPAIVGPMDGGFNGTFNSASAHEVNTLNLQLDGISAADGAALQAAITASAKTNAMGTYYSGTFTLMGVTYHWEDFAKVQFTGKTM